MRFKLKRIGHKF